MCLLEDSSVLSGNVIEVDDVQESQEMVEVEAAQCASVSERSERVANMEVGLILVVPVHEPDVSLHGRASIVQCLIKRHMTPVVVVRMTLSRRDVARKLCRIHRRRITIDVGDFPIRAGFAPLLIPWYEICCAE